MRASGAFELHVDPETEIHPAKYQSFYRAPSRTSVAQSISRLSA
jgi:hypothetical protein